MVIRKKLELLLFNYVPRCQNINASILHFVPLILALAVNVTAITTRNVNSRIILLIIRLCL
jgi:hypothetical protein